MTICPVEQTLRALRIEKRRAPLRKLAKRIKEWRLNDNAGYDGAIGLLCEAEVLLRKAAND